MSAHRNELGRGIYASSADPQCPRPQRQAQAAVGSNDVDTDHTRILSGVDARAFKLHGSPRVVVFDDETTELRRGRVDDCKSLINLLDGEDGEDTEKQEEWRR